MLFKSATLAALREGRIGLAFRRWPKARVKAGSRIRISAGLVVITSVETIALNAISEADARKAGYESRGVLLADIERFGDGPVYKIGLVFAGADPRAALREKPFTTADGAEITRRLERLDKASKDGPWTRSTLSLIARHPAVRAADLAAEFGWETQYFKIRVRKLKELGLTESLEIGYRISPCGAAYLKTAPRA